MATIIVGVEDSFRSEDAVALAGDLARIAGAEVLAVGAYSFDDRPNAHFNYALREPLRGVAEDTLDRICEPLHDVPVDRVAVADVSPARALLKAAEATGAALIVVGSSRAGFHGGVHPGGTAWRLLQGAQCAVAIAPQGHRLRLHFSSRPVAAAYDGSAGASAALGAAAGIAQAAERPLRAIRVFRNDWLTPPTLPGFLRVTPDAEQASREELERAVEEYPGAEGAFLSGDPARELSRESEHCALMVVGSRDYGPSGAVLLGGVSGRLVYTAMCPLVIVPHGVDAPLGELFAVAPTVEVA